MPQRQQLGLLVACAASSRYRSFGKNVQRPCRENENKSELVRKDQAAKDLCAHGLALHLLVPRFLEPQKAKDCCPPVFSCCLALLPQNFEEAKLLEGFHASNCQ